MVFDGIKEIVFDFFWIIVIVLLWIKLSIDSLWIKILLIIPVIILAFVVRYFLEKYRIMKKSEVFYSK
jgi:hypothetical protein